MLFLKGQSRENDDIILLYLYGIENKRKRCKYTSDYPVFLIFYTFYICIRAGTYTGQKRVSNLQKPPEEDAENQAQVL